MVLDVVVRGAAAGLAGGLVMTAIEKAEQALTGRPSSYVPGRTLGHLVGLSHPDRDTPGRNLAMHFGTAATGGVLRAGMAAANLRGGTASFLHTWVRLAIDQTLGKATRAGAPRDRPDAGERHRRRRAAADLAARRARDRRRAQGDLRVRDRRDRRRARRAGARHLGAAPGAATAGARVRLAWPSCRASRASSTASCRRERFACTSPRPARAIRSCCCTAGRSTGTAGGGGVLCSPPAAARP